MQWSLCCCLWQCCLQFIPKCFHFAIEVTAITHCAVAHMLLLLHLLCHQLIVATIWILLLWLKSLMSWQLLSPVTVLVLLLSPLPSPMLLLLISFSLAPWHSCSRGLCNKTNQTVLSREQLLMHKALTPLSCAQFCCCCSNVLLMLSEPLLHAHPCCGSRQLIVACHLSFLSKVIAPIITITTYWAVTVVVATATPEQKCALHVFKQPCCLHLPVVATTG